MDQSHRRRAGAATHLALAFAMIAALLAGQVQAFSQNPATIFINEIHYDNTGTDAGEAIEIAGPAGTDLTGWSIVLYNGASPGAAVTYDTDPLPSPIPNLGGTGFGVVVVNYPSNGIQNGPTDGLALVNNTGQVVQFLSYEGQIIAANGPAAGLTSTNLGITQSGTEPVGSSIQLQGSGATYQDFNWIETEGSNTFGAINVNQSLTAGDAAPSVSAVAPANGASDVAVDSAINVTFSEAVNAASGAFSLSCNNASVALAVSGGPTTFTLDPDANLPNGATCTLTVSAALVTDQDALDPPDAMAADFASTFSIANSAITLISAIQGSGSAVTSTGPFTVEAIVVGDYQTQGSGQLRGFFLQEEDGDADANPATSEGLFVFCSGCPVDVAVGDRVRVSGSAGEFFDMSQLSATTPSSIIVLSSNNTLPTPATPTLPVPGVPLGNLTAARAAINAYFEQFEGMLVRFNTTLTVAEYFELARYGQIVLAAGDRPRQFTDLSLPSAGGYTNHLIDFAARTIILDDTNNAQNDAVTGTDKPFFWPRPGLSATNRIRGGDMITNLTGVLHWSFAGQSGTDAWRIRPVEPAFSYAFTSANPRPAPPAISGSLKVAAYNVLNYFLTVDETSSSSSGPCGANQLQDCRGADSAAELARQREKLTQALLGLDADIVGLIEMENTPGVNPTQQIVDDLNAIAGAGTYAHINTGVIGTDAIRVGIIFRPGAVTPIGGYAVLDSSVDPNFDSSRSRPALAQTFRQNASGGVFTLVVNHFKSKGASGLDAATSTCTINGPASDLNCDQNDGQGYWNNSRTRAAQALAAWLANDPTGSGDPDIMIVGDLNAYRNEDPVRALETAGYLDLIDTFMGASAYSYLFSGQLGYLDHALANASLAAQVAAVTEWHINADEIPLFDYNDEIRTTGESSFERESTSLPLYEPNAFRTSDHDPVIVGMNLDGAPPTTTASVSGTIAANCPADCFFGSATVTLNAVDPSGVTGTWYRVNGGDFQPYSVPFVISNEGANLVEFYSRDSAGNVETPKAITIKVTTFPATNLLDDYNRADGRLGANWSGATKLDQYRISANQVDVTKGGAVLWNTEYGVDQEAFVTLTAIDPASAHHTLLLKGRGVNATQGAILVSYDARNQRITVEALEPGYGWRTVSVFADVTMTAGDILGARAMADGSVKVYINCLPVGAADTTTVVGNRYVNVGGRIGLFFHQAANAAFDNFGGGNRE